MGNYVPKTKPRLDTRMYKRDLNHYGPLISGKIAVHVPEVAHLREGLLQYRRLQLLPRNLAKMTCELMQRKFGIIFSLGAATQLRRRLTMLDCIYPETVNIVIQDELSDPPIHLLHNLW